MTKIIFLGTAGGRFATIYQTRATGGIYISDTGNLHIDPGPGALLQMHKHGMDPTETDCILISHCHPDHYSDAEILIEAMTRGGTQKKGMVVGSKSVMDGAGEFGPTISKYHRGLPSVIRTVIPGDKFSVKGIKITATPCLHSDSTTVGFVIETKDGIISYISDTSYWDKLHEAHHGSRILILSVTRPLHARIPYHLSTEDAAEIVKEVQPEMAVLTHLGLKFIKDGPDLQAYWTYKETGIKTIAAEDGMVIEMNKSIDVRKSLKRSY